MLSCVLILPLSQVATGNAVGAAMGWGPASYSVALSADGADPATHMGLHTWATEEFQQMIATGYYPPDLADAGIEQAAFDDMMAVLVSSFQADYMGHFAAVCEAAGLMMVVSND